MKQEEKVWLDWNVDSEAEENSERDDADAARLRYLLFYIVKDFFSLLRSWDIDACDRM